MPKPVRKHFVTFYSPGTLMAETSTRPIDSWDPVAACQMASAIVERYGARPYGFRFETRLVAPPVDDGEGGTLEVQSKTVEHSGMYYLDGTIETLAQVEARADPAESILRSNMRGNGMDRIVVTVNGYKSVHPFTDEDRIVDSKTGEVIAV